MNDLAAHDRPLLKVSDLEVHFTEREGWSRAKSSKVYAVDGISFEVRRGSTFGLVGESGCGKSTTGLAVLRLVEQTAGSIELDGIDLTKLQGENLRRIRHRLQIVFQDPYSSMDPRRRAEEIVREPLDRMRIGTPAERRDRVDALFAAVGLRPEQRVLFPHQFSGGQRQRIGIARALAARPDLIVCDEPVSALDVAIQAQILNLLAKLQRDFGLTYLFISHDLRVVQYMCDEIAVMYLGKIVERGGRHILFAHPLHPYTRAMLSAVPSIDAARRTPGGRIKLQGDPPSPVDPPVGCRFHTRCPFAERRCRTEVPELRKVAEGRYVACHLVDANGTIRYGDFKADSTSSNRTSRTEAPCASSSQ